MVEATISGFEQGSQRESLAPYAEKYFAAIERVWADRSIQIGTDAVQGLFPSLQQSQETLDATDASAESQPGGGPAAPACPGGPGTISARARRASCRAAAG
ncbi:aminopeptidase [Streptomyces purpurascens]